MAVMTEEKNPNPTDTESENIEQALQNIRDTIAASNTVAMGDVLELTEIIDEAGSLPAPESASIAARAPIEQLEPKVQVNTLNNKPVPKQTLGTEPVSERKIPVVSNHEPDTILSPEVMAESQDMLEQFLHQTMPPKAAKHHSHEAVTLEDFAAAILRKEISTWINKHLPDMVRSVIEKEIKHLINKSRD